MILLLYFLICIIVSGANYAFLKTPKSEGFDPDEFDVLMVVAGLLWPLVVGMAIAYGLFKDN